MIIRDDKRTKDYGSPVQDVDIKRRTITGLFAHFGSKDRDGDIIIKGAFKKSISENGPNGSGEIAHLLDHKKDKAVGSISFLEERNDGLYYESEIGDHDLGVDFLKMVQSKIIKFHSIGFSVIKEMYDDKSRANIMKELMLYEGSSLQFWAANPNTPVLDLKSDKDAMQYLDRLEKFIRTTDCTDETIITLETRLKSLTELLKPVDTTLNDKGADLDTKSIIEQLKKTFKENGRITT
jgi:HK97 family phage prohead protease